VKLSVLLISPLVVSPPRFRLPRPVDSPFRASLPFPRKHSSKVARWLSFKDNGNPRQSRSMRVRPRLCQSPLSLDYQVLLAPPSPKFAVESIHTMCRGTEGNLKIGRHRVEGSGMGLQGRCDAASWWVWCQAVQAVTTEYTINRESTGCASSSHKF
jgi:hypothetical protein